MTTKIDKVIDEIAKLKSKIADYQTRLRDLERLKTEMENAEIVSLVRGVDVAPDKLRAFIELYKQQNSDVQTTSKEQEENEVEK